MLQDGTIEESTSLWSSPIVVVPKLDGNIRLCNDFWKLNLVSDFDSSPLPEWMTQWRDWGEPNLSPH